MAGFLSLISSKITVTKEEERRKKERGEGKDEKKKNNGRTLSFCNSYFEDSFWPKKTVGRKRSIW